MVDQSAVVRKFSFVVASLHCELKKFRHGSKLNILRGIRQMRKDLFKTQGKLLVHESKRRVFVACVKIYLNEHTFFFS